MENEEIADVPFMTVTLHKSLRSAHEGDDNATHTDVVLSTADMNTKNLMAVFAQLIPILLAAYAKNIEPKE